MYNAKVYRLMIAGAGDTPQYKQVIRRATEQWNALMGMDHKVIVVAVDWEHDSKPEMGSPPQVVLNRQLLDTADCVIAVFHHRLGTPTPDAESGTVEEIQRAMERGLPAAVLFSKEPWPQNADLAQVQALLDFKRDIQDKGLFREFESIVDLESLALKTIHHLVQKCIQGMLPQIAETQHPPSPVQSLSSSAADLLRRLVNDGQGELYRIEALDGEYWQSSTESFSSPSLSGRERASFKRAIDELFTAGMLTSSDHEVFELTAAAYDMFDSISPELDMPPFPLIRDPMALPRQQLNPPWPDQVERYRSLGYEISTKPVASRAVWESEGYRALVFKDPASGRHITAVYTPVADFGDYIYVGRKAS